MKDQQTLGGPALDLEARTAPGQMSAVVVLQVRRDAEAPSGAWREGPLPIVQPINDFNRGGEVRSTVASVRRTIIDQQQGDVLYGDSGLSRRHLLVEDHPLVLALELLAERSDNGDLALLAVHVAPPAGDIDDHVAWLRSHVRGTAQAGFLRDVCDAADVEFEAVDRPWRRLSFADLSSMGHGAEDVLAAAYAVVSASSPWRSVGQRAGRHALTIAKPDWSALVLRDGGAYLAHDGVEGSAYAPTLRMLVHSLHVDALLLALVQRALIDRSGGDAVRASLRNPDELLELETNHFDFRRKYWRSVLTDKRTAPPDDVLRQLQAELLTAADVEDVEKRISDGARLAQSLHAKRLFDANQRFEDEQHRFNTMVEKASVVIGSFAVAFTATPVLTDPGVVPFALAVGAALIGMVVSFAVLSFIRARSKGDS